MSKIQVDLGAIRSANYNVPNISSKVNNTKRMLGIVKWKIPEDIVARYSIRQRIENVYSEIDQIEKKLNEIHSVTNSCVCQYEKAENDNTHNADMFI